MIYKYADDSQEQVAVYKDGSVEFMPTELAPIGVDILPAHGDDDEADFQRQKATHNERDWRDMELRAVLRDMDQLRNDREFGMTTYKGTATLEQLNAYRVMLCNYPDVEGFPYCDRPSMPDV